MAEIQGRAVAVLACEHTGSDLTLLPRLTADLAEWGESQGATQLLFGTYRNPRAWERRLGFKHFRDSLRLKVSS